MKKGLIVFIFFAICVSPAKSQEDTSLTNRLNIVLEATSKKDYNKILDYTYPKLYSLIPKEKMFEALESAFDNEDFSIALDSIHVVKIYPVFVVEGDSYTKIEHTMLMQMKFKEQVDTTDKESLDKREEMANLMQSQFGEGNVRYDRNKDAIVIHEIANLVAIKTKTDGKWYFINYDKDNPQILNYLFSKPVLEKIETYQ